MVDRRSYISAGGELQPSRSEEAAGCFGKCCGSSEQKALLDDSDDELLDLEPQRGRRKTTDVVQREPSERRRGGVGGSVVHAMSAFRWKEEGFNADLLTRMSEEVGLHISGGWCHSLKCFWFKQLNILHLTQTEHMITRLQTFSSANLQLKVANAEAIDERRADLLDTMRTEFKHATPWLQIFVKHFDHGCMSVLKSLRIPKADSLHQKLHDANSELAPILREGQTCLCDIFGITEITSIHSDEFKKFSKELPFGSVWLILKLWDVAREVRKDEQVWNIFCSDESRSVVERVLDACCEEIPFIMRVILDELLPSFLQKMSLLRSALVQDVDRGHSMQNNLLAGMASGTLALAANKHVQAWAFGLLHGDEDE